MEDQRFDGLVRVIGRGTSRRGALGLLAGLVGLGLAEVAAKGPHHKAKHHGKGNGKGKGKGKDKDKGKHKDKHKGLHNDKHKDKDKGKPDCVPEPVAQTCDGQCGEVRNTCGELVDCGACTCASACPASTVCGPSGACQACTVSGGGGALATAVAAAAAGDTLYVCAGTYDGGFSISTAITVIGAGQGADGTVIQGGGGVVNIAAGTAAQPVTLERVRIQNGSRGVVIGSSGVLTMRDCTVTDNSGGFGAGIFNLGGTLVLTRCTIERNTAPAENGFDGGGLYNFDGAATLTGCLVQGNSARNGGGIFNTSRGAIVTLSGTRVTDNTASEGSGIFNDVNNGGTVTLQDGSTVCANHPPTDQCHLVTGTGTCTADCPTP